MTKTSNERLFSFFIAIIMLFVFGNYNYVSATEVTSSNNVIVLEPSVRSYETVQTFGTTTSYMIGVEFDITTAGYYKIMLAALYTDGSSGQIQVEDEDLNTLAWIDMDGTTHTANLRYYTPGHHSIVLWPDRLYSQYSIAGQVYHL